MLRLHIHNVSSMIRARHSGFLTNSKTDTNLTLTLLTLTLILIPNPKS